MESRDRLRAATLVAVIRDSDPVRAAKLVEGLIEGGLRALEVTANTPGAFELVERLGPWTERAGITLGMGTIRTVEEVERAQKAGASFVVSPHTDERLIEAAKARGLVSIPGAMTPTEVIRAHEAGADFVKLFPISAVGGPRFLKWLRGPLPDVPYWVSGDVALDEIEAYLAAGATLIGLTSALTAALEGEPAAAVRGRASLALEALSRAKEGRILCSLSAGGRPIPIGLKELRRLPGSEHTPLESLGVGLRGHGVRARLLLRSAAIPTGATVRVVGRGQHRNFPAQRLYDEAFLQFAVDGRPIADEDGGPLRLHLVGGGPVETINGLSQIEVVSG
ncbi:MAG: bifunctional 4-hydroxy-2-oxoglutarate aldolase/2-dehydro-3-deoxy-phosphogluconate aldolase [Deltaproteobacteria bacterium]|nr:bifunctional 4-hydroxy-2-oxoglutarate aldolase/2-dehydro-3-deoxy-phosphogluconate aldolase [Deltaproteobacteria bacterium]